MRSIPNKLTTLKIRYSEKHEPRRELPLVSSVTAPLPTRPKPSHWCELTFHFHLESNHLIGWHVNPPTTSNSAATTVYQEQRTWPQAIQFLCLQLQCSSSQRLVYSKRARLATIVVQGLLIPNKRVYLLSTDHLNDTDYLNGPSQIQGLTQLRRSLQQAHKACNYSETRDSKRARLVYFQRPFEHNWLHLIKGFVRPQNLRTKQTHKPSFLLRASDLESPPSHLLAITVISTNISTSQKQYQTKAFLKATNRTKSHSPFIAGHDYLFCEYRLNCPKAPDKYITCRKFKNCDHIALANSLNVALNQNEINIKNSDLNELLELFLNRVLKILDEYAPEVTFKVTGNSNSWITRDLKNKCHDRDILYKRARRTKDPNLLAIYKDMRKKLKIELNQARENYLKTHLATISPGKTIWSKLKHLELIKTNSTSPLNYFDNTLLNEHFANIVRKHPPCDVDFLKSIPLLYHSKVDCTFKWHQIDIVDVTKALHLTLQKSKGKSPDGLNLNWLRDHLPQISLFLTSLFNRSLESGIFPDAWKMVYIIPLNKAIADWARDHGLQVNLSKRKAMIIGTNSKLKSLDIESLPPIIVNNIALPYVNQTKGLGLLLNNDLSWNSYVSQVIKRVNSTLYSLKIRKNIYSTDIRKLLVTATILPLIDYCSIVLIDSTADNNLKLQRSLNNTIRFIYNLRRDEHITPYRRELNWLSIKSRRLYYLVTYFYKLLQIEKPNYLRELFIEEEARHSERLASKMNNVNFELPKYSTFALENSFVVIAIRLWKNLSAEIVNASSLEVFKVKMFDYLLELDFQ
ncbi:Protein of unknown function [Cotesia congregata]|uniref:Reverse transcriptase domain-containing protein n=1 Tax=Cotesia congregata TaxID=51543 RepID=A0A8J2HAG6_COTCN|nr:Protein of unknown function [Cotesia congregata]